MLSAPSWLLEGQIRSITLIKIKNILEMGMMREMNITKYKENIRDRRDEEMNKDEGRKKENFHCFQAYNHLVHA